MEEKFQHKPHTFKHDAYYLEQQGHPSYSDKKLPNSPAESIQLKSNRWFQISG